MIKVLVSDMDGTLFKDHRDTIFDLSIRNEEALKKIQNSHISFYVASGRMISYGKKLLEDYHFKDIIVSGFNGADIYDNGKYPIRYNLDTIIIYKVINSISNKYSYNIMQIQTLDSLRIFSNPNSSFVDRYRKQNEMFKIDNVSNQSINEFLNTNKLDNIGKFSIIFDCNKETLLAFKDIQEIASNDYFVTMSGDTTIEICNKKANKGVFIKYLQDTYHYKKEEIAVIGDALNDMEMFPYAKYTFAMNSGIKEIKDNATYVVSDVRECIDICLKC